MPYYHSTRISACGTCRLTVSRNDRVCASFNPPRQIQPRRPVRASQVLRYHGEPDS